MNNLIEIRSSAGRPSVSGRELHEALGINTPYTQWFGRMTEYGFTEDVDYTLVSQNCETNNPKNPITTRFDHELTISMAKEICMLQRNDKGKQFRQYFIQIENAWNSPEMVMKRALAYANESVRKLEAQLAELQTENAVMQPKAEYFDELVERNTLTNFRETAKQLDVKEKAFIKFLLDRKYIYHDKKGKIMPYADKNNGLFTVRETFNKKTQWSGTQTLVTPKGRETFRILLEGGAKQCPKAKS